MESVVFHQNIKDLNCILCTLPDVTEFCNEAVTVWTMAPAEAHVTAFIEMWCSNPTTGDGGQHTPPQQSPLCKETPRHLHTKLGDLDNSELQQLVQDLSQEISQCGLTMPPAIPLLMTGLIHWVVKNQGKMTRRSPFQEGEGGVQRGKPPQF